MAVHGTMISSLPRVCHRAGTCRDSGGSTLSSRRLWRSMTADSEDLALELGHLQAEPAGLGGQAPVVVAGAVHLPLPGALVSGGVGDLVGLKRRASRSMVR